MKVIYADNPDHGLYEALYALVRGGAESPSRNGPVLRFRTPVTTVWNYPTNRVSFNEARDSNPTFALMESLWMLVGRNDVAPMAFYAKQMEAYSDDGKTFNAAYGYRWRKHFGHDQLEEGIEILKKDPSSRQVVIQIWDHADLTRNVKDKACNTSVMFDAQLGRLNMTVTNRSNDTIWGCYGANVVHFSMLHEYVSVCTGIPIGYYYQVSNNLHVYTEFDISKRFLEKAQDGSYGLIQDSMKYTDRYLDTLVRAHPLDADTPSFLSEANNLVSSYQLISPLQDILQSSFLREVAEPMRHSYAIWKSGMKETAHGILSAHAAEYKKKYQIPNDWLTAGLQWMDRRIKKEASNESK